MILWTCAQTCDQFDVAKCMINSYINHFFFNYLIHKIQLQFVGPLVQNANKLILQLFKERNAANPHRCEVGKEQTIKCVD